MSVLAELPGAYSQALGVICALTTATSTASDTNVPPVGGDTPRYTLKPSNEMTLPRRENY